MAGTKARTSRWAPKQVQVDLGGEALGLDLVDGAGGRRGRRWRRPPRCRPGRTVTASAKDVDRGGVGDVERVRRLPRRRRRGSSRRSPRDFSMRRAPRATGGPGGGEYPDSRCTDAGDPPVTTSGAPPAAGLVISGPPPPIGMGEPTDVDRVHAAARRRVRPRDEDPTDHRAQRDLGLQPGQVGAEAEVPAAAEAEESGQLGLVAVHLELVRVGRTPGRPGSPSRAAQRLEPFGAMCRQSGPREVAREQLGRGVHAQRLLDPAARLGPAVAEHLARWSGWRVRW